MSVANWKRIVIKVGSALIAPNQNGCSSHYLLGIAQFIVKCRTMGIEVVLVSSGSVAAGSHLFEQEGEINMATKKAMAAAGQSEMMATWDRLFDFPTAQILVTHGDLRDRERYVSIKETIFSLLDNGILPILNENDTVTTDKLKVGDNDNLSAMISTAADADTLIICSDVDGLYDSNPHENPEAKLLSVVNDINPQIYAMAGGATSAVGTGGMKTKIQAAEKAVAHGIDTYIINGFTEQSFNSLMSGNNPGTHFSPDKQPMQEHLHWMTHTSTAQGEVVVDNAFTAELDDDSEQLTSEEIVAVNGDFAVGDTILVRKDDGTKLAKAKSNYSSCLLSFIADQDDKAFASKLQNTTGPIISDNNIALLEE
ncbi:MULTISPECIES: glutamate 5-kinase [Alteromonadaceae]|jgi:glutamate 5-kinase|uniref:Glutamate 5-kinase n=1 Tax=Brumicola blandensis TaxID=3075611 RepID=A0AAW8R651_9ALTE|nr:MULTISPECIES: glutamate 5-kinase [unclassified Alteromonas]MDT0584164.1 glutamate 5-kinase [Alteromonas sp. W409]MDT0629730.1 glutamate 5-kinase [Alteromonas sp. W364]